VQAKGPYRSRQRSRAPNEGMDRIPVADFRCVLDSCIFIRQRLDFVPSIPAAYTEALGRRRACSTGVLFLLVPRLVRGRAEVRIQHLAICVLYSMVSSWSHSFSAGSSISREAGIESPHKTRADTPAAESIPTAFLSNETNVSAPSHLPS
jgi:hypothetical protein